jgi:hypothetical protein
MQIMTEVPTDLFAGVVHLGIHGTPVGELLAQVADAPAGAWTAVMLDGADPTSLRSAELPAYLSACARVQAWAAARLTEGVAEIASRRDIDGVDVEVAIALAEPIGAAQRRIWHAKRLRRLLPATMELFKVGDLSQRHAEAMVDALRGVDDPELAKQVEGRALARLGRKTAAELRKHARRILTRLDPAGAEERARAARDQADVTFEPDDDGMSDVHARLPVEDGRMVKEAVDAAAISAKQAGDTRPIGVLRAKALADWAADSLTGRSASTAPRAGGRPIEVGIVVGLQTALGREQLPAEVPGCGLVPRDVVAQMVAKEMPKLRLLVVDESTGRLVYRAVDSYRPTAEQVAHVRAAWVTSAGPGSQVFATRCDTDHVVEHPKGPTSISNLIPPDRTWHKRKTHTPLSVTIDPDGSANWNTALGQSRTVTPYDYLLSEQPSIAEDDPPPF